jgi:hypothetical protein
MGRNLAVDETTYDMRFHRVRTNTARPVKLLNGTQNIWASDLSDRKI